MEEPTDIFIRKFHNLRGITIGKRRRELFNLISSDEPNVITSRINARTSLEENFKIQILLHFDKFWELIEILKSQNIILIGKILKNEKFIDNFCTCINGNELVSEIFSNISYRTKIKLLNKISLRLKNTVRGDEYFEMVKKEYGLYLASKLLPCCSLTLILPYLAMRTMEITPKQLLVIVQKYASSTEVILEKVNLRQHQPRFSIKYAYVLKNLVCDSTLLIPLMKSYEITFTLGSRVTKTFLKNQKSAFMQNPDKFHSILKNRQIFRDISDIDSFYFKLLPKSLSQFSLNWSFLRHVKQDSKKLQIMLKAFRTVYGCELLEQPKIFTTNLLEMMTLQDRIEWMKKCSKPNSVSEISWIKLKTTEESVPHLTKMLSYTTNLKKKAQLLSALVNTCRISNDADALLSVLEYVCDNHRNDHFMVRQEFLNTLSKSLKLSLQKSHWLLINKFIETYTTDFGYSRITDVITDEYIRFSINNNMPIKDIFNNRVKLGNVGNTCLGDARCEKICLEALLDAINSNYTGEDLMLKYIEYLNCLENWNCRYSREKFNLLINDEILDSIKTNLKSSNNFKVINIATQYVQEHFDESGAKELLDLLLNYNCLNIHFKFAGWLIKNHPLVFLDNINKIVTEIVKGYVIPPYVKLLSRYYEHLEIPQQISKVCLNFDQETNHSGWSLLVNVVRPQEFLCYIPKQVNVYNTEAYKTQKKALPLLGSLIPSNIGLTFITQFLQKEYLKNIQKSLYSAFHNINEDDLNDLIMSTNERSPAIKKHVVLLAFKVLNIQKIESLMNLLKNDTSKMTKKSIFKGLFNLFLRNPNEHTWNLTKNCVNNLDLKDPEVLIILSKCKRVASEFFNSYFIFVWEVLDAQHEMKKIEEAKTNILEHITDNTIILLPKILCQEIISKHFLKCTELSEFQLSVQRFSILYILYKDANYLINLLEILKNYTKDNWNDIKYHAIIHKVTLNFIKVFCSYFLNRLSTNYFTFTQLINFWDELFHPWQLHKVYLYLHFTEIIVKFSLIEDRSKNVMNLIHHLSEQDCFVLTHFYESFLLFEPYFVSSDKKGDLLIMVENIIKCQHLECSMFATHLLPKNWLMTPTTQEKWQAIINILMASKVPSVQIHMHSYLRNFYYL